MRRRAVTAFLMLGLPLVAACGMLYPSESRTFVVFFTDLSAQLDGSAQETVTHAAKSANDHPAATVYVSGYSAADTSLPTNFALSATRAHVVADALRKAGVDGSRIRPSGKGPVNYALDPVQARRVDISIAP